MTNYITSHDAKFAKGSKSKVYIPQYMRDLLPKGVNKLYAAIEGRAAGTCIVLSLIPDCGLQPKKLRISNDGYVSVKEVYQKAGMTPPFRWQATAQMPTDSIDTLILWQTKDLEVPAGKEKEFANFLRTAGKKKTI